MNGELFSNNLLFLLHSALVASFILASLVLGCEALTAAVCLVGILANLFVTKQVTLFGLDVVATDVFAVGAILGLNLLQEYFGKAAAHRAIAINFVTSLFYLAMCQLHLWYTPNPFDATQHHFAALLTPMPRIIVASVVVSLLVQRVDSALYALLKRLADGRALLLRNGVALLTTQLLDTLLFSVAALYGTVHSIGHVIAVSYAIKLLVIGLSVPFIALSRRMVRIYGE